MVRICRERGTVSSVVVVSTQAFRICWRQSIGFGAGNIGKLTAATIPSGLPREVSGGGCVQLTLLPIAHRYGGGMGGRLDVTAGLRTGCRRLMFLRIGD